MTTYLIVVETMDLPYQHLLRNSIKVMGLHLGDQVMELHHFALMAPILWLFTMQPK